MTDSANPVVKITEIEGRGRAVVASRSVKAGEIVLRDSPLLVYSAIASNTNAVDANGVGVSVTASCNYCANCFRNMATNNNRTDPSSILTCPSCSRAVFCSPSCRSIAVNISHSAWVCQALSSVPSLDPDFQVQAHFLVAAYNLAFLSASDFNVLLSLQGEAQVDSHTLLSLHSFISSLSPPPFPGFSPQLTAALLAKDKRNAFGLMEPFDPNCAAGTNLNVRAYAIYPKASFFNHDCLPNAARFDYVDTAGVGDHNTDIIVRAIHDIPQGREICLSYFPVNWNFRDRQRRLKEDYGFDCRCDRCEIEVNWKVDDDDDDDDDEDCMEEDKDEEPMEGPESGNGAQCGADDFPHAYFFLNYVCDGDNCSGTLAPLPPSEGRPQVMECNVCGHFWGKEEIGEDEDEDGVMLDD